MPLNSLLRAARAGNMKRVVEFIEDELVDINASNQNGLTALHSASKEGHTRIIEELISRGANVHAKTLKGNTALHIASLAGHEPVVRLLIANGADVDAQSVSGFTALYMAAQENHESIVRLLLANGANQNIATTDGFTPLAVAMQQGHEQIASILLNNEAKGKIRFPGTTESGRSLLHIAAKKDDRAAAALLIQNNISPDVTSKSGFTALHVACHYGNESVAKLLIDRQADVNFQAKHNITPLHVAAKWGQGKLVNLLLANRARIDATTRDGLTPLHCAARSGHDQVVEDLIRRGAPISAKTRSGLAPLHMATQGDHLKSAQILLSNGAPVDDVTVDYLTALHVASHCGHVNVAKLLLASKADPNFRAQNGFTSLHIACKKNRLKIVELLLKHGASMNSVTESGLTPLHVASFMGCVNIVIYLLDNGAQLEPVTVRGETPLHLATRANQIDVINVLLRYGANVDARAKESQTALHIAARLGNADIARLLIEQGIDVDAPTKDSYTALHIAAKEGHESVVAMLLDNGANISCATRNHGFTPLHLASKYGIDGVVDLLLSYGAPVDAQGKNGVTSLHVATHYDHPSVVQLLLMDRGPRQPGASPHAMAKNGYTALHIAAKGNRLDIADAILRSDANPNAESKAGFCPLHLAAQEGRADMAALLLNNGAKVNCRAKNGITPLHLCAQEDHVNVAQLLVKRGAFLDEQTKGGFTPLHVASHFARLKMIRFLLANGANVNIPAASGYTPVHQASQQGNPEIVELLLEYNAKPDALTESGQTALSIAENLGYVSIVDTLRVVTETVVKTTRTTVTEEKFKIVAPETMQETFVSDSEDEADDQAHAESVRFLTTDVMKNFNSSMADDYATSQSNLTNNQQQQQATAAQQQQAADNMNQQQQHQMPTDMEELEAERRALQQRAGSQLAGSRPQLIVDEMQQDLQYLAREAPLDGGESTFGAYSQLGGGSQHGISSGSIAGHEQGLLLRNEEGDDDLVGDYDNDPNRSSSRQDSESAALVANYARGSPLHRNLSETPTSASRFAVHNELALDSLAPDNVDIQRPLQQAGFLVSFMVDARGGAMRGCRHSGVRVIIPPNSAQMPMRITCRYLRRERLVHPPMLMEGEACASKILEVGPAGAKFLGPVLIEVPHFASLRGQEREIIILRSETGDVWREDPMEADEALIEDIIRSAESAPNQYGSDDKENISIKAASSTGGLNQSTIASASDQQQQQQQQRLTRIVTTEFPQYFAIISRIRQEVHAIGPQGAVVDSQLVPKVQAIFTEGALTKRIKIGLQAQRVPDELVLKLFGSLTAVTFSPIVTIEPRRRKFHCPIKLKIPLPASYRNELAGNLRLLCSISAPQSRALWEDVTGVTPLSIPADNSSLMFTTTVSARFWLVHCRKAEHCQEITRFAQEIYRYLICVPYMAKFVIFAKRRDINEAILRVFCMTDDKEERTLEVQEHYTQVAKSRDVEVLDGQPLYLEFGGNLVPTHLSGQHRLMAINSSALINEQLSFLFHAFQENRLAFAVRLREVGQEPSGRIAFMEDSMKYLASLTQHQRQLLAERRRRAVCTLGLSLPVMCVNQDNILGTPKRNSYYASTRIGDLTLADIANELDQPKATGSGANVNYDADSLNGIEYYKSNSRLASGDWVHLAPKLGIPKDEVEFISDYCATQLPMNSMGRNGNGNGNGSHHLGSTVSPALILLMHWFRLSSPDTRDQDLARALVSIKREDIAQKLNFPIEPKRISRSTMELLREIEMIPVRSSENLYANSEVYPASSRRRLSSASSRKTLDPATQVSQQTSRSRSSLAERTDSGNIASTTTGQQQRTGGGTLPAGSVATGKDANQPKGSGGKRSSGRKGHKS